MSHEELVKEFSEYVRRIINKVKTYYNEHQALPVVDYDFMELSNYDSNKALLFMTLFKQVKTDGLVNPNVIYKDDPEMLLTYYYLDGRNTVTALDKDTFLLVNCGMTIDDDLEKMGAKEGDIVKILDFSFEYRK